MRGRPPRRGSARSPRRPPAGCASRTHRRRGPTRRRPSTRCAGSPPPAPISSSFPAAGPRAVLGTLGHEVVELRGRGATTACSGGGGGLPLTHPAIADGYRDRLAAAVAEAAGAGAAALVTGCATCAARLAGAVPVPVLELAEACAAALEARR